MSKEKLIILFTVAIDVIGLGIIIPIMPIYVESFGVTAFVVTTIFTTYALFTFLSAPFLGALSDKIGRRPVLLVSILSTSIGWFVFASAGSLFFLFLGRIIDGLAAGNFSTAQSAISDLSKDQKERTVNLGLVGAVFGVGFIVGPLIGGLLTKVSTSFPFYFVGCLALFNFILAYFFLPETNKHINKDKVIVWNPLRPVFQATKDLKMRKLYLVWLLFNIVAVGTNSIFALYLLSVFGFGALGTGLFFTGVGLVLVLNQGVLLKKVWLKYFSEKSLIIIMLSAFVLGFVIMAFPFLIMFILGMFFVSFGQSTLRVLITSEVTREASLDERGKVIGILSGIGSVASIIGPLLAGALFGYEVFIPFAFSAIISIVAIIIISERKFPVKISNN